MTMTRFIGLFIAPKLQHPVAGTWSDTVGFRDAGASYMGTIRTWLSHVNLLGRGLPACLQVGRDKACLVSTHPPSTARGYFYRSQALAWECRAGRSGVQRQELGSFLRDFVTLERLVWVPMLEHGYHKNSLAL